MVATDGRVLASVEVWGADIPDMKLNIDPSAFRDAKRHTRAADKTIRLKIGLAPFRASVPGGPTFDEPDTAGAPDPMDIVPDGPPVYRIGLNAKLLLDLAKALGGEQVLLEIHADPESTYQVPTIVKVRVIGNDAEIVYDRFGLIHPVHPR